MITLGKKGTPHHRRLAITELGSTAQAKKTVKKVFDELTTRFKDRKGGYTRIMRLPTTIRLVQADLPRGKINRSKFYGTRLGDSSTLVLWELCEAEVKKREKAAKKERKAKKPKVKKEAGKELIEAADGSAIAATPAVEVSSPAVPPAEHTTVAPPAGEAPHA